MLGATIGGAWDVGRGCVRTKSDVRVRLESLTFLIIRYNKLINASKSRREARQWEILKDRVIARRDELLWVLKEID